MTDATIVSNSKAALTGAFWMVFAGVGFALSNVSIQYLTMTLGLASPSATFWQYFVSLVAMAPVVWRIGFSGLKTRRLGLHILRVGLAALGVQLWVAALAYPVPIWQAIALLMTSPFFVTIGAALVLGERVTSRRWGATLLGFMGGMIILAPWSEAFVWGALLPVAAAVLWGSSILCMKKLEEEESPQSVTLYLLLFLSPINLLLALGAGFEVPGTAMAWWLVIAAGLLGAVANSTLAMAYARADAAYLQPFDHLKLPLNVLCGFIVFGWVPPGNLWLGAALIIGASLFIVQAERKSG